MQRFRDHLAEARNSPAAPPRDRLKERYVEVAKKIGLAPSYSGSDSNWLDEVVDNPIKKTKKMTFTQAKRLKVSDFARGTEKKMRLSTLKSVQDYVNPEKVEDYIRKLKSGTLQPLNVTNIGGDDIVVDGTHRLVAMHLSGVNTVNVNYIENLLK